MVSAASPGSPGVDVPGGPVVAPVGTMPDRRLSDLLRELPATARRIWLAWAMLVVSATLGLAMIVALAVMAVREGPSARIVVDFVWGPLFCATVLTGLLILHRYPGHRVGWVLCLAGFTWVTTWATYLYSSIAIEHPELGLPAGPEVLQSGFYYPFGLYLILVELLLIFPTGRLASPRWRIVRILGLLGALGASLMVGFGNSLAMNGDFGDLPNPWHVPGLLGDMLEVAGFGFFLTFAMGAVAGVSMVRRLRRATGVQRAQLRWIAWDTVILVIAYAMHVAGISVTSGEGWYEVVFALWGLALNSVGIVVGIAILRYRLYDIDLVIHRSVLYASLIAIIAAFYLILVNLLNTAAQRLDTGRPTPLLASVVVAAGVALVAHPLRQWLEGQANRRLYGARDNPGEILDRLSARLEAAVAPAELLGEVTRTFMDLLRLPHAAIALRTDTGWELVAEAGTPGSEQVSVPMVYQHEQAGELRISPRGPGEGFSQTDAVVLEGVARQTAVAAYALRVTGDLQLARERLVTAREEERRRLRRDLHDGLGAQLAALAMQAGGAKRLLRVDADRAEMELDHVQAELRSAIADIRRLVHGLRPPALDEFGLVASLRSRLLAFGGGSGGFVATLDVTGDDAFLPAAIEVAIYRIIEEALTNASRHANARHVAVTLDLGSQVALEIVDDGRGIPSAYEPGIGVQSMRERTEELGGAFTIDAVHAGGTRISVTIPLPVGEDA